LIHTVESVSLVFMTQSYPNSTFNFIWTGCIFGSILVPSFLTWFGLVLPLTTVRYLTSINSILFMPSAHYA
jgi:hypothetical protein